MKLLIFLTQSANTIIKLKAIRNHQIWVAFADLKVNVLERIKNHTEKWLLL